jgi:hypothetical protein
MSKDRGTSCLRPRKDNSGAEQKASERGVYCPYCYSALVADIVTLS